MYAKSLCRVAHLDMFKFSVATTRVRRILRRAARLGIFRSFPGGGVVDQCVGLSADVERLCPMGGGPERAGMRGVGLSVG